MPKTKRENKTFQCSQCPKRFPSNKRRVEHQRKVHGLRRRTSAEEKKKGKDAKKGKKQESSSSSGSESSDADGAGEAKKRKTDEAEEEGELLAPPVHKLDLPPPEAGIQRFEFAAEEVGPLGLRFSGGFPPLIVSVNADSFAATKKIPPNFEVHAVNGLPMVPQNQENVMDGLKKRPVTLDVRPIGWKPPEKVKELERKRMAEEAEKQARIALETHRREQVEKETKELEERLAAERAEKAKADKAEYEEQLKAARAGRALKKEKEEDFEQLLAADPKELRSVADDLMEAEYGSSVKRPDGKRGLPLRMLMRRKEVAWYWAGEVMECIGGGVADDAWTM